MIVQNNIQYTGFSISHTYQFRVAENGKVYCNDDCVNTLDLINRHILILEVIE